MSKEKTDINRSTRRQFAKTLAGLAAMPLMPRPSVARAPAKATPQAPPSEPPSPSAEALTEVVRNKYKGLLTEDQLTEVKRSIDRGLRNGDRLKQFDLKNSDEPAFAFSANVVEPPADKINQPKRQAG